eukprot:6092486-Pleurochrysis_carterae.AAC.1
MGRGALRTRSLLPQYGLYGHRPDYTRGSKELRTGGWGGGPRCPAGRASAVPHTDTRTRSGHPSRQWE